MPSNCIKIGYFCCKTIEFSGNLEILENFDWSFEIFMELLPKSNPGFWRWSICFVESSNFSRNWVFWCSKLSFRAETSEAAADFVASNSACNSEFIAYLRQTGSLNYHAPDLNRKRVSDFVRVRGFRFCFNSFTNTSWYKSESLPQDLAVSRAKFPVHTIAYLTVFRRNIIDELCIDVAMSQDDPFRSTKPWFIIEPLMVMWAALSSASIWFFVSSVTSNLSL